MISKQVVDLIKEKMSPASVRKMEEEAEKRNPSLDGQIKTVQELPKERKG